MSEQVVPFLAVQDAAARIQGRVRRTPTVTSATMDRLAGRSLVFKCENLQTTGSFKIRGAMNAVWKLPESQAKRGFVTHSSGNHAQALAKAAAERGSPAWIVMPRTSAAVKKAAVAGYGATIVECEPILAERERMASELVQKTGGTMIPPFDHLDVIAGQGTATVELLADEPDLDAVLAPVGGGGLLSGTTIAAKGIKPGIVVYGAEPAGADDAYRSKLTGEWVPQTGPKTIADGLLTSLGELTWPIIRDQVDAIYTVTEAEIVAAMRLVFERMKLVIEPSAAVGVAVVLSERFRKECQAKKVGVILCGGNVDLDRLPWQG